MPIGFVAYVLAVLQMSRCRVVIIDGWIEYVRVTAAKPGSVLNSFCLALGSFHLLMYESIYNINK